MKDAHVYLSPPEYRAIKALALKEQRTLPGQIRFMLAKALAETKGVSNA